MVRKCARCGYKSSRKTDLLKHFQRKELCQPILEDVVPTEENMITEELKIICEYCDKSYSSKRTLKRHQENSCQNRVQFLQAENSRLQAELNEAKKKQSTTNINNPTFNIQINVNGYRDTDFSHLTDRHFQRSIRRMVMSVPQMIQDVHFNPKVPENHNIYISNIKGKYAMVYDGKKWCVQDQDEAINQLINDQEYAMEDWLGEGEKYPHEMAEFNRYLEKKENDEVQNVIKEEVKMLLYNNRKIIKRR